MDDEKSIDPVAGNSVIDRIFDNPVADFLLQDRVCSFTEKILKTSKYFLGINAAAAALLYCTNGILEPKTAVFTNSNPGYLEPLETKAVDFFMYTPIVLRQALKGKGVKWVSSASTEEINALLRDLKYENVVFVGHGSGSSYQTSSGSFDLYSMEDLPKRKGELVQHTCGSSSQALRNILLEDPARGYQFRKRVSLGANYLHAWKRVLD